MWGVRHEKGDSCYRDRRAIHALKPPGAAFHHLANANDEMSGKDLGTLLGRVTERSTREVDNLIDELQELRKK